ncbi:MAG: hypothetical protein Q9221_005628 [Calogaya cf. arnoldii]
MTSNPNPTIVIIPGAWHPASLYSNLVSHLQTAGYSAIIATYPSSNSRSPQTATCENDAIDIRKRIITLIEDDQKDLLLFCHSYGGIPCGGAATGLSKQARLRDGKGGGIIGLVYMSAFIVPEGSSLRDFLGGKHAPYLVPDTPSPGLSICSPAIETLFHDIDPETATHLSNSLIPHAILAFESAAPTQAWAEEEYDGKRGFLRLTHDRALPTVVQDMFVQRSGVTWDIKDVDAGHDAHISRLQEVCEAVIGLAGSFQQE